MRESWIPLFQDIRNSSLWVLDSDIRIVWFTLLTMADPEGYVAAALPGIAHAANVPLAKAREAIALFEAPDPDSRTTAHEGRRIEKVPRGWLILTYADHQKRARHEADKARKRRWAREHYQPANDNGGDLDAPSENLDASKSKSKSKSKSDLPSEGEMIPPSPPLLPVVLRSIPEDWDPSEELIAEGIAQLGQEDFDRRIAELREKPIGGTTGVLSHKLEGYVRRLLPKWRTWAETDRAKAQQAAQAPRGRPTGGRYVSTPLLEPNAKHRAFATKYGLNLSAVVLQLIEEGAVDAVGLTRAREMIGERLSLAARAKQRGASF